MLLVNFVCCHLRFQEHVKRHTPSEMIGVDEYLELKKNVLSELNRTDSDAPDEAPPGEENDTSDDQIGTSVVGLSFVNHPDSYSRFY